MIESDSSGLFFDNTLRDTKFYFYCPNMSEDDKILITNLIKESKGVRKNKKYYLISFSIANHSKTIKKCYNNNRRRKHN